MVFKHLDWDSDFFGKKIGRIDFSPDDSETNLIEEISIHHDYDLLYIFSNTKLDLPKKDNKCNLVDQKITYLCNLSIDSHLITENKQVLISELSSNSTPKELELLAYQSGIYSRFNTDKGFNSTDFYRLYKEWIDKSVRKEIADAVYIASIDWNLTGFVSIKFEKQFAKIGLIAVDQNSRGNRVGSLLIEHLKMITINKGINKLFVDTQLNNKDACKFYEKNGFNNYKLVNIYHYWIK